MRKIKIKSILLILSLFLLSFNANAQSPIQLKLATFEPPKAFFANKVLGAWAEKVNKESNGRLEVKVFALKSALGIRQVLNKLMFEEIFNLTCFFFIIFILW